MDSTSYYTSKYSGEEIDEAVRKILDGEMTGDYADRQLSNLDTPQAALANLGAGVRPSLLVNGDFRAGHVVNQRGQTSYATNGYTLDMWRMNGGTLAIDVDGISFTSGYVISQKMDGIDLSDGIARTVSYMDSDGDVYSGILGAEYSDIGDFSFTYDAGDALYVMGKNNAKKIRAMKLEEGDTQTLAYQDEDGAWQLLPQPESDYATQLLKCQRYFRRFPANWSLGGKQTTNAVFAYGLNPPMRTAPAVSLQSQEDLTAAIDDGVSTITPTAVIFRTVNSQVIEFYFTDIPSSRQPCIYNKRYLDASADL